MSALNESGKNLLALVQGCKQQEKGSKNDPVIDTKSRSRIGLNRFAVGKKRIA
jgi:uncharacterized protein (DUF1499 family)